jgi:hypothetical protein
VKAGTSSVRVVKFLTGILLKIYKSLDSSVNDIRVKSVGESAGSTEMLSFYNGKGSVSKGVREGGVVSELILFSTLTDGSSIGGAVCAPSSSESLEAKIRAC